jgi:hypothetical protein
MKSPNSLSTLWSPGLFAILAGGLLVSAVAPAADHHAAPTEAVRIQPVLKADLEAGRLTHENYLLQTFRLAFAPEKADPTYTAVAYLLEPCLTPWIAEFGSTRESLGAAAVAEIEAYLLPDRSMLLTSTYVSPSGIFELHYETAGVDAVPLEDVDPANGIPDFVERCGEYFDTSWQVVITDLGFAAPLMPADGTYDVFFVALSPGLFGYTAQIGVGRTEITIDNNFTGPGHVPSPDPDGAQLGRAKGVIAHEFKHASQWRQSSWTEGTWNELDSNWVMDVVFDPSDIYHAWLGPPYPSQLNSPRTRLDNNNSAGNYEDLLWETYMGERFGVQCVVDFGARRGSAGGETVKKSYQETLALYGSEWDVAYPEYMEWCWFTGSRSIAGFGFEEASDMMRMNLYQSTISTYPFSTTTSVNQLAAHHRRFNPGTSTGNLRILFDGDDAHENFTVSVLAVEPDNTITIVQPTLDANNDFDYTMPFAIQNLTYAGVIVTNSKRAGGNQIYSLDVELSGSGLDAPVVAAPTPALSLSSATPNPFRGATRIAFSLPTAGHMRIDVHDVRSRQVRRLVDDTVPAGPGDVVWGGDDDAGRALPAGVYWVRLVTAEGSVNKKVTMLR